MRMSSGRSVIVVFTGVTSVVWGRGLGEGSVQVDTETLNEEDLGTDVIVYK